MVPFYLSGNEVSVYEYMPSLIDKQHSAGVNLYPRIRNS